MLTFRGGSGEAVARLQVYIWLPYYYFPQQCVHREPRTHFLPGPICILPSDDPPSTPRPRLCSPFGLTPSPRRACRKLSSRCSGDSLRCCGCYSRDSCRLPSGIPSISCDHPCFSAVSIGQPPSYRWIGWREAIVRKDEAGRNKGFPCVFWHS